MSKFFPCAPGDLCVIVSEEPGCECNIGATLEVVAVWETPEGQSEWLFRDASRPLLMLPGEGEPDDLREFVEHSFDLADWTCSIEDRHLVPIESLAQAEALHPCAILG